MMFHVEHGPHLGELDSPGILARPRQSTKVKYFCDLSAKKVGGNFGQLVLSFLDQAHRAKV